MHKSLIHLKRELSSFGLNPAQWLIQKISLQKEGIFVLFESTQNQGLQLKGLIQRTNQHSYKLGSLEIASL